jgi:acid phosphatase
MVRSCRLLACLEVLVLALLLLPSSTATAQPADVPIEHIVVIYLENHTFDNLYGKFPGANGLDEPGAQVPQSDKDGTVYQTLPQPFNNGSVSVDPDTSTATEPKGQDQSFPADLPNASFPINEYVPLDQLIPSPVHRFYQHQLQMNGGKMDRYVAWTDTGGLPMGYHGTEQLPLYPYARSYTLADNFFTGAFGGSMLNHFWLVCSCTPVWPDAPAASVAQPEFDAAGDLVGLPKDGVVTPDGYVVNDVQPFYHPYQADIPADARMPPQALPTIGERLSDAGVSWAWYAGGWNDALAGNPAPTFVFHHQPFVYFEQYADGTPAKAEHLKDEEDFLAGADDGSLPAVSFVKPIGKYDEHAGYSTVLESEEHAVELIEREQHAVELIERVKSSPDWDSTAIIVTYDDFGGWYDHVAPPLIDRWGPGGRVPMLLISPYARKGFVDHTLYDTTSILKFIEWRYGLEPLTDRDAGANNLLPAFDFSPPAARQALPESGGSISVLWPLASAGLASLGAVGVFLWRRTLQR